MTTRSRVEQVASQSGFLADPVEKALRLCGILERLGGHPATRDRWRLKGGTALNLLHLDVPRMSVDIDLNFTGAVDREGMLAIRPEFEAALTAVCEREGCTVKRTPDEHAGGKFRLRFASVSGGTQNLEVDVSYVARVPLLDTPTLTTRFPDDHPIEVPTLSLLELAAGKFTALVQRTVARDAFDAANLLTMMPGLLEDPGFRLAFTCSIAGGRHDPRELVPNDATPTPRDVMQQLVPLMQRRGGGEPDPAETCERIGEHLRGATARLLDWTAAERRFLDRLHDDGMIDAEALTDDPDLQGRIRIQPMLLWKSQNVRDFRKGSR